MPRRGPVVIPRGAGCAGSAGENAYGTRFISGSMTSSSTVR